MRSRYPQTCPSLPDHHRFRGRAYIERNTVLYPGQTWFVVPATYLDYVKSACAYLYNHNSPPLIWLITLALGLTVAMLAIGRLHKLGPDLLRSEPVRLAIGCVLGVLAVGFVSRGFVAYMYLSVGLPMINLLAYCTILALLDVIYRLACLLSGSHRVSMLVATVAAVVAGSIVVNTNSGWPTYGNMRDANYGDTEFYLLEQYATRGVPVASNVAWPLTGIVHGITGRVPISMPDAASIPRDGTRQFDLYLCHSLTDHCNLEHYTGTYTVLGQDERFMLVKLD